MKKTATSKFRLLPYQAFAKHWLRPAMLFVIVGVAFWWFISRPEGEHILVGPVLTGVGALITLYTLLAKRAHVSCRASNFVIQTPLYPVAFSYRRVEIIRPVKFSSIFSPVDEKNARRRFYQDIWGKTAVVVVLQSYPLPLWWLKLWFHPYLLHPKETALVFLVDDWMALSRGFETRRTLPRNARRQR